MRRFGLLILSLIVGLSPSLSRGGLEHDLFRKPATTFRDHALKPAYHLAHVLDIGRRSEAVGD